MYGDLNHLAEIVFVRFLCCKVTPFYFSKLHSLEGSHFVKFILKEWWVMLPLRVE